ncbi:nedd4 binding protein 3 [Drosophila biarmipes]|uniref:nedd4 binding protein 3 n=1 Tax=Drosophila biarmipes TaxID=125945 RepID=UPI0007E88F72|nr:nedd4 binding protein 3 [Drosophila biarmipes]
MVNELHKPQNGDNAALSERLAASNRQLQEMQEEHRQLLEEMETLRVRAAELTRLNTQRTHLRQSTEVMEKSQTTMSSQVEAQSEPEPQPSSSSPPAEPANQEATPTVQKEEEEDKEETASYLQAKLNEIANLKAQFKRVQNMVDTTKMIEQHMSTRQVVQTSSSVQSSRQTTTSEVRVASEEAEEAAQDANASSSSVPDNAELLNSMLNMFTDFTSDLRGQAESLRAERDRIRTLKEDIIQRKQGK